MTDHHDPLDDLASAHLDGLTTADEAARFVAEPALATRVEQLRAARAALRATDHAVDPARREEAIAAALAVFDDSKVTPLARVGRSAPSRRALQLVGAAAAVILLALLVPLVSRLDSGSDDTATFHETGKALDSSSGGDAFSAAASTTTLAADGRVSDLGSFAELPELADAVRARLGPDATAAMEAAPSVAPGASTLCTAAGQPGEPPYDYVALAELDGRLALVIVRAEPDGGQSLLVLDRQDCTTISAGRL